MSIFDLFKTKQETKAPAIDYESVKAKQDKMQVLFELTKVGIDEQNAGNIDTAIKIYEDLIKSQWDGRDIYTRLSDIYISRGQNEDAIRILQTYIDMFKGTNSNYITVFQKKIEELQN